MQAPAKVVAAAAYLTKAPKGRWGTDFMSSIVAAVHRRQPIPWPAVARATAVMLCSLSLSGCASLERWQRKVALRPTPTAAGQAEASAASFRPGDERFLVSTAAGAPAGERQQVAMWWLPQADPQAPALLYLHGTFRNLYQNLPKIEALRTAGFAILAVDYRGWGDSTALVPSEATIHADAALAWAELKRRQSDPMLRLIYGHSMGGAVAVRLASGLRHRQDYAALVLESTFTTMPDVAASAGFWGRLAAARVTLEFDSLSRIGAIDAPLLMMHGSADRTVPLALGQRLRDAAPPGVRWAEFGGGTHSRLQSEFPERYQQTLREFIEHVTPAAASNTKRRPTLPARTQSP
jgi:pimeloyl-ACP methyl ester carboxylesterase